MDKLRERYFNNPFTKYVELHAKSVSETDEADGERVFGRLGFLSQIIYRAQQTGIDMTTAQESITTALSVEELASHCYRLAKGSTGTFDTLLSRVAEIDELQFNKYGGSGPYRAGKDRSELVLNVTTRSASEQGEGKFTFAIRSRRAEGSKPTYEQVQARNRDVQELHDYLHWTRESARSESFK